MRDLIVCNAGPFVSSKVDGGELQENWRALLIDDEGFQVLEANPILPPEIPLDYLPTLKAVAETRNQNEVILLLLDEESKKAFRVTQRI